MLTKAFIPYRGYYSTPFVRWQGSLASEHSIILGANTSRRFFESKGWDPKMVEYVLVGSTVYQKQWFYSGPWAAGMMGAAAVPGVLVSQACSTSTFAVYQAGMGIETVSLERLVPPRRPLLQRSPRHLAQPERPRRADDLRGLGHGQLREGPLGGRGDDPDRGKREQGARRDPRRMRRHHPSPAGAVPGRTCERPGVPEAVHVPRRGTALQKEDDHRRRPTRGSSPRRRRDWPD